MWMTSSAKPNGTVPQKVHHQWYVSSSMRISLGDRFLFLLSLFLGLLEENIVDERSHIELFLKIRATTIMVV